MSKVKNIVLLHGWGLNSGIWDDYVRALKARRQDLAVCTLNLPGYGGNASLASSSDLHELALSCLAEAPEQALWVGWSLGGQVAMQAALLNEGAGIQGLQLLCTTPKFTQSDDWLCGVELPTFERFCAELGRDYKNTLTTFLLLQAGSSKGARDLARAAHKAVCKWPAPSLTTLEQGIECLAQSDLRDRLSQINVPAQVVSGRLDRVINPESSRFLANELDAQYIELNTGHLPFVTNRDDTLAALLSFTDEVERALVPADQASSLVCGDE